MAAVKALLPAPAATKTTYYDHSEDPWFKQRFSSSEAERPAVINPNLEPPYFNRGGFVPRKGEDFGDGGAFPEIHIAQYPLGMGRGKLSKPGTKILPVSVDARGNIAYDAIVKQTENAKKIVFSQHKDLVPKILKNAEEEMDEEELLEEIEQTTAETKAALEKIVNVRLSAAQPKSAAKQLSESKLIKYKPSQKSVAFNSGAKERLIRMMEMPVDPLEPAKFKHKRVPRPSGSPPVPVMHSPPRPVTEKDRKGWKVPPSISLWKNSKGYTIPLDKRLACELGALRDAQVYVNFGKLASLSEALYIAEKKAKEEQGKKTEVRREMVAREKARKEQELRELAHKARAERVGAGPPAAVAMPSGTTAMETDTRGDYERPREKEMDYPKETREERRERLQREKIREERRRKRERERRLEDRDVAMGKKSKITRDRDRDISEKVALGMASVGAGKGAEVMYDQRLFNQAKGMDSGFAAADEQYNVYDKGLFTAQPTLSTLYRPKNDVDKDMYGVADEKFDKIFKTDCFKPDKRFGGTAVKAAGPRDRPVEFEKDIAEEADPFGLDKFLTEVKKGKNATEKVGTRGTMGASAGPSMRDGYEGEFSRSRIGFERGR